MSDVGGPPPPGTTPPGRPASASPPPFPQQPPPPGYGTPMPGSLSAPAAAPVKRRRIWPWIVGVLVVLVLLMGGCVALVYRATTGPVDKANEFLGHVEDGDFDRAAALADPGCFADGDLAELETFFDQFPLERHDLTGAERFTGGGAATGTVQLAGAGERDVRVELTNDDGWRVCGIDITGG